MPSDSPPTPPPTPVEGHFPNTHWTAILALRGDSEGKRGEAMRSLCAAYWFPLYAFARQRGNSQQDAEDAVQDFFCEVGDAAFFGKADQQKGKLRSFILIAFTRLLSDKNRRANTQKRGGAVQHISLDVAQAENWLKLELPAENTDPVLSFEKHWAVSIMRTAVEVLRNEAGSDPVHQRRFNILSRFLSPEASLGYSVAEAATDLGVSESTANRAVHRLRQHFRLAVRELIARTLSDPTDADVTLEMQELQKALIQEN